MGKMSVNFTSWAYDRTAGVLLTKRLSVVWKIRVWLSKNGRRQNI